MKPVEALNAQLSLISSFESQAGAVLMGGFIESTRTKGYQHDMFSDDETGERFAKTEATRLNRATTYLVERDMIDLVTRASWKMPFQTIRRDDAPSEYGFVVLDTPVLTRDIHGRDISIGAFSWGPAAAAAPDGGDGETTPEGTAAVIYSDTLDDRDDDAAALREMRPKILGMASPRYAFFHVVPIWYGQNLGELEYGLFDGETTEENPEGEIQTVPFSTVNNPETGTVDAVLWLYAFWVMSQQRIVHTVKHHLDRVGARRMRREMTDPPIDGAIQVVTLRRLKVPQEIEDAGEAEVINWSHRWIVSGFWRHQWYPSLNEHRLVWIDEYIKGPDHLPLVIKDQIFHMKR